MKTASSHIPFPTEGSTVYFNSFVPSNDHLTSCRHDELLAMRNGTPQVWTYCDINKQTILNLSDKYPINPWPDLRDWWCPWLNFWCTLSITLCTTSGEIHANWELTGHQYAWAWWGDHQWPSLKNMPQNTIPHVFGLDSIQQNRPLH